MTEINCNFYNPVASGTAFQFASSSCSKVAGSSTQLYLGGFSYGEMVTSTLLWLIFLITAYQFLFFWLRGIKVKKW